LYYEGFTFIDESVLSPCAMPNQTRKDTEIVARIHEGDREVLIDLYKQYEAMISNHVFQNSGNEDDAKDVLQDTLVALWQNVRKPHFELTVQLSTYLFAIAKNTWLKQLDKRKRLKGENYITGREIADSPNVGQQMDYSIVRKAMESLQDKCRNILIMFYFDGFDMKTIAAANGLASASVAKAKKHQCLKGLEGIIKQNYSASDFYLNTES
jgi:RNA polymerase sigma factor (sigma-70 family)